MALHAPETGYGPIGLNVFPTEFWSCFNLTFPCYLYFSLWNGNICSVPSNLEKCIKISFWFYKGSQLRVCQKSQERLRIWHFEQLWRLLKLDWMHFILWDGDEPFGDNGWMLWFKVMCSGVKLMMGDLWWLILIANLTGLRNNWETGTAHLWVLWWYFQRQLDHESSDQGLVEGNRSLGHVFRGYYLPWPPSVFPVSWLPWHSYFVSTPSSHHDGLTHLEL
jgi:hypothetical protein